MSFAADPVRPSYVPPSPAVSSGSIVQILFSLMLVLAVIVLVGWLLKRMNLTQQNSGSHLKMLGGIAIGQRERIVLVEIDETWLVIGVGPGQIRTLHTLPRPEGSDGNNVVQQARPGDGKFAALLSSVIRNRQQEGTRNAP